MASGKLKKDKDGNWEFEPEDAGDAEDSDSDSDEPEKPIAASVPGVAVTPDTTLNLVSSSFFSFICLCQLGW